MKIKYGIVEKDIPNNYFLFSPKKIAKHFCFETILQNVGVDKLFLEITIDNVKIGTRLSLEDLTDEQAFDMAWNQLEAFFVLRMLEGKL